ncbi:hypothetical protein D3C77_484550 [compost metagenome]
MVLNELGEQPIIPVKYLHRMCKMLYLGMGCNPMLLIIGRLMLNKTLCSVDHHLLRAVVLLHKHVGCAGRWEVVLEIVEKLRRASAPAIYALPVISDRHERPWVHRRIRQDVQPSAARLFEYGT